MIGPPRVVGGDVAAMHYIELGCKEKLRSLLPSELAKLDRRQSRLLWLHYIWLQHRSSSMPMWESAGNDVPTLKCWMAFSLSIARR